MKRRSVPIFIEGIPVREPNTTYVILGNLIDNLSQPLWVFYPVVVVRPEEPVSSDICQRFIPSSGKVITPVKPDHLYGGQPLNDTPLAFLNNNRLALFTSTSVNDNDLLHLSRAHRF